MKKVKDTGVRMAVLNGDDTSVAGVIVRKEGGFTFEQLRRIVNMRPPKKVIEAYNKVILPAKKSSEKFNREMMIKMFGENYNAVIQELREKMPAERDEL